MESGKKVHKMAGGRKGTEERHVGHTAHVLSMAISSDGKYLVRAAIVGLLGFTGSSFFISFLSVNFSLTQGVFLHMI